MKIDIIKRRIENAIAEYNREYENDNGRFEMESGTTEERIALFGAISKNAGKVEALMEIFNFIVVSERIEEIKAEIKNNQ